MGILRWGKGKRPKITNIVPLDQRVGSVPGDSNEWVIGEKPEYVAYFIAGQLAGMAERGLENMKPYTIMLYPEGKGCSSGVGAEFAIDFVESKQRYLVRVEAIKADE